ncbi:MAG: hypothetical protein H7146_04810, partial [Burkholderiaceae bacterium]|nr:hypothetical protein [Microbacteriaceae bacterium]
MLLAGVLTVGLMTPIGLAQAAPAADAAAPQAQPGAPRHANVVKYVDPLIGTANGGNTYPGAVRPFGMLSWSPTST